MYQKAKNNIKTITQIAKVATCKASYRLGIKLQTEDYKEEVQKCIIFIMYNGNKLKKNNEPSITSEKYKECHGKLLYIKALYYEMSEIKKLKIENSYNDKFRYKENKTYEDDYVFNLIEGLNLNKIQKKIVQKLNEGYQEEEIIEKEGIKKEDYIKNITEIREKIQLNNRIC